MTEVLKQTIKFFMEDVHLNLVYVYHAKENVTSGKVIPKCRMKIDSIIKDGCQCNCGVFDKVVYKISAHEYRNDKGVKNMRIIDMHCDTIMALMRHDGNLRTSENMINLKKLQKSDYMLQCFAMFVPYDQEKKRRTILLLDIVIK